MITPAGNAGLERGPHQADYERAKAFLRRATWVIASVVLGLGGSLVLSQIARARIASASLVSRHITRTALAAELALAGNPAANVSTLVDSLEHLSAESQGDTDVVHQIGAVRAALTSGNAGAVRSRLDRVVAMEDSLFTVGATSQPVLQRVSGLGLLLALIALLVLVFHLRRRLSDQLDRALENQTVIESQNERLRVKRDTLALQTEQLQTTAMEMETQAGELEEQTLELESTIEELRGSERQHRAAAEESAQLARRLAEAQRVAQLGYWEIDSATGEVFWSDEMYALAGLDPRIDPPPTDRFIAAVHPDDRERMAEVAARAAKNLTEFTEQYRLPSSQPGAWRTVQARGRVMTDANGTRKLVGTVQDITERAQLEGQLRRSQKMEAVGQLAGGVAHDFNNILTVIEGYSSLLLASCAADDPAREDVEEIRRASARAATLTRQLLAFSRQQVLQARVLDVNATITSVERMLRRLIGEHIAFRFELDSQVEPIKADPGQLEQVIVNLVVNARDAMPSGGVLTIQTARVDLHAADEESLAIPTVTLVPGPHVMLAVTDTGTGIAPDDIEHIFEPFFTTKESGRGTGLGLSTVHGIVEQSGGHIRVTSEVGAGTSFKLYFPRASTEQPSETQTETATPGGEGSEIILLVEDDSAVRTVAGAVLRRAGYSVVVADNGAEAMQICDDPSFQADLVVTDMVMPVMGGRDLAENLRRMRPSLPIVFMSGYTRETGVYNSGLVSGESFIEKPFTPETLTRKVREVLDRSARRSS